MTSEFSTQSGGDLDQLLRRADQPLGAAGRRVARFIDENRQIVLASSAAALGDRIGTSDATVVRTIQALGFAGLGDLKRAILNSIGQVSTPPTTCAVPWRSARKPPDTPSTAYCRRIRTGSTF